MTDFARRTIEELIARYELEPTLDDVYVEGVFDREVITSALGFQNRSRAIYEVETVDIPSALLLAHGLTEGNQQRVIALARELSVIETECAYICLADRDLDHWFGELESTSRLKWCQHCAIELHFFTAAVLHDLLIVTCKARILAFDELIDSLITTLTELYLMRLADRKLLLCLRWVPFTPSLSHEGSIVTLAVNDYVNKLLQANGKFKQKQEFLMAMEMFRISLSGDCRSHIRGHDFVDILVWVVHQFRGIRELASQVAIQRLFILMARSITSIRQEIMAS